MKEAKGRRRRLGEEEQAAMIAKFQLAENLLMIENVSTQLTVFHCLCPLPASRKGLHLPLRSALFGEGGRDWRP